MATKNSVSCAFDVFVNDCYPVQSNNKDTLCYIIMVCANGISYFIHRSQSDLVEFDRRIKKRHPLSVNFDLLPGMSNVHMPLKGTDEYCLEINQLMAAMNMYISKLIQHTEVLSSDDFWELINAEIPMFELYKPTSELPSLTTIHDILLQNDCDECIVSRTKEITFDVEESNFVLWKFTTENFDIGFTVELNGVTKVAYTRYESHEKCITGCLEIKIAGSCTLKWDNSYSLFHTKTLLWACQAVTSTQYVAASHAAHEIYERKKGFQKQMRAVKKCLMKKMARTGCILNVRLSDVEDSEEDTYSSKIETELIELRCQVAELQQKLINTTFALEEERKCHHEAEASKEDISASWQFTLKQLERAKIELRNSRSASSALTQQLLQQFHTQSEQRRNSISSKGSSQNFSTIASIDDISLLRDDTDSEIVSTGGSPHATTNDPTDQIYTSH